MFGILLIMIWSNIYLRKAIGSRYKAASAIYFDPTTGVTSAILTNIEIIGPNKLKELDDIPLIVVNIPPVRDPLTTR